MLLAVTGCRQLPQKEWNDLEALRRELRREGLAGYLPDDFSRFEASFAKTRHQFAVESNTSPLFRNNEELAAKIAAEIAQALRLREHGVAEKTRLRKLEQEAIEQLENSVVIWRSGTLDPDQRRLIARIELQTANAKAFWQQSEFLKVRDLLEDIDEENAAFQSQLEGLTERYRNPRELGRWQLWAKRTIEWSRNHKKAALVVDKYNRQALLYNAGKLVERLPVDLGWNRFPDKVQYGDGATPEGRYRVTRKKSGALTKYFLALLLDYPNAADRRDFALAKRRGEIHRRARIGALIEIHGEGGRGRDWTQGCAALSNPDMERLYGIAYLGMPVTIVGQLQAVTEGRK